MILAAFLESGWQIVSAPVVGTTCADSALLPRQVEHEPEMISRKSSADDHLSGRSFRKMVRQASDGIRQSPLGERETEPTLGQSGRQERLNCWAKKRLMNVFNHLRMVASSYMPSKALRAMK